MFAAMKSFICILCPSVFSDRRTDSGHEYFYRVSTHSLQAIENKIICN
jgi:hypothetical protein